MTNPSKYEQRQNRLLAGLAEMAAPQQDAGAIHYVKNVLNGGEIGPELWCRTDQQRHGTGFHELLNMLPLATGGITRRPGLEHLGYSAAENEQSLRLLPFTFSATEACLLELAHTGSHAVLRAWEGAGPGRLLVGNLPFTAEICRELSWTQSADVIFLAHEKMAPCKISRYGDNDWRFETINWLPPIDAPEWEQVGPVGNEPDNENRRISIEYVVTAVDRETGAESGPSRPWKLEGQFPLTESRYIELWPKPMAQASEYRFYKKSAGVFGYIGRVVVPDENDGNASGLELKLDDKNIAPDTEDTPPDIRNPFDGPGNWPSVVFLHQQRLGYAASRKRPLTFWLSQSGNFESMAASIPPDEDDAIEATLAAPQANRILWAISDRNGLAFGTEGGEWLLAPGEGAALTPADLSFQPQTSYGSSDNLPAVKAASSILFCQRGGRVIRDLGYSFQDDRYNAQDLSILARHITRDAAIKSMTWQQEPNAALWAALADGKLAGLTYLREHEVMAWHRHETEGRFLQCVSIPEEDGDYAVYFAIERVVNGMKKISVERFRKMNDPDQTDGAESLPYESRAIPTTPDLNNDRDSSFGHARKISSVKFCVLNSKPFSCRVLSQNANPSPLMAAPARSHEQAGPVAFWNLPLNAGFLENPVLEIRASQPLTILAIVYALEFADMQGNQK